MLFVVARPSVKKIAGSISLPFESLKEILFLTGDRFVHVHLVHFIGVLCTPKEVQYFRVRVHIILYWLVHVEVLEGVTRTKRSPVQYDITRMVHVPKFEQILITKRRRAAIVGHHYIYKIEDTEGGGLKKQT